jgi:hypothetical protein
MLCPNESARPVVNRSGVRPVWLFFTLVAAVLSFTARAHAQVGVCLGDFFCQGAPSCASTADCPLGRVCAIDTCCGPGVCAPEVNICRTGQGASGPACPNPGTCGGGFVFGCGAADPSCQVDFSDTLCATTDFLPMGQSTAPTLSLYLLPAVAALLTIVGGLSLLRRVRSH